MSQKEDPARAYRGEVLHRCTMMAGGVYLIPENEGWATYNLWNGTILTARSVPLSRNVIGMQGKITVAWYLDTKNRSLYVSLSGTRDPEFWLYNTDSDPVPCKDGWMIHEGFFSLTSEVFPHLMDLVKLCESGKVDRIYWTGHSAGGACAGIMPFLFSPFIDEQHIIDFGTPRYLLKGEKPYPFPRLRFQNIHDVVPCLPLRGQWFLPRYRHFGFIGAGNQCNLFPKSDINLLDIRVNFDCYIDSGSISSVFS